MGGDSFTWPALSVILVIAVKAYTGRGTPLRGGLPSGHAAVAFAGWMAITLLLDGSPRRFLISSVTFIMALLVAQTRVETGVHSASEVVSGAVLDKNNANQPWYLGGVIDASAAQKAAQKAQQQRQQAQQEERIAQDASNHGQQSSPAIQGANIAYNFHGAREQDVARGRH